MDTPDFIAELEKAITNAGADEVWKRTIGDKVLWLSPVQSTGQEKTNEMLANPELGVNVVFESKKITLSHAIVGIGELDLRQYRGGAAVFPILNKEGKPVKVRLEEYIFYKMKGWGGQYVDDVFAVYADLLETHQKNNLKEIRFENAKDPRLELLELETRVAELRSQLGMPPLVEQGSPAARAAKGGGSDDGSGQGSDTGADGELEPAPPKPKAAAKSPVPDDPDFNPFSTVRNDGVPQHVQEAEARRDGRRPPAPQPQSVQRPYVPPTAPALEPLPRTPTPEDELFSGPAAGSLGPAEDPVLMRPRAIPLPPVDAGDVIEAPAERVQAPPPRIDSVQQNVNPRFARPAR